MRILLVSVHDFKRGLASLMRIRRMADALSAHVGAGHLQWLNVMPVRLGDWRAAGQRARELRQTHACLTVLRQPDIPLLRLVIRRLVPLLVLVWAMVRLRSLKDVVLWTEMVNAARPAMLLRRAFSLPLVVDLHGTIDEVVQFAPPTTSLAFTYARFVFHEARVLFAAAGLVAVSQRMLDVYRARYGRLPPHTAVVPCVQPPPFASWDRGRRATMRDRLGLGDRFVLVYAGGTDPWQCVDEMIDLFARWRRVPAAATLRPFLLLLVWNADGSVSDRVRRAGIPDEDVRTMSVPHDQVVDYLLAADAGLLLRRNVTTNLVSSPTKAAEYLQAGLPIVCTPYVGDVPAIVEREEVGIIVELEAGVPVAAVTNWASAVHGSRDAVAERCIAAGATYFGPAPLAEAGKLAERVHHARRPGPPPPGAEA